MRTRGNIDCPFIYKEKKVERTRISENNMSFLEGQERSPREMVEFVKAGALYRSFGDVLTRACPDEAMALKLVKGMTEITGENPESVARKVRNWLKGKNVPKNRKTLFQICFCLGLNEEQAGSVLGAAAETGIHYRNPEELVYAFGLRTGMSYQNAEKLRERMLLVYRDTIRREGVSVVQGREPLFTRQLRDEFSQVTNEEELEEFFREHSADLGELHETAYRKFTEMLEKLQKPETSNGLAERKYTINEIMELYFQMHVPQNRRAADYTNLQKLARKYWPNETSLLNMRNRKEDVSRKVMILLYLITEDFDFCDEGDEETDAVYYYEEDDEEDADAVLERRFRQMNLFLNDFGMNPLDQGNLFDYLVLYAMKTQDGEQVSERMEQVLELLFEED